MDSLIRALSEQRFGPYLRHAGHDSARALRLYEWNMQLGASFVPLLGCVEVCFRNPVAARLETVWGAGWWEHEAFHALLGKKGKGTVLKARDDIRRRGATPETGRMTAELSFGFWSRMLQQKYVPALWQDLASAFPNKPATVTADDLYRVSESLSALRNRIFHHEPIFARDISADYSNALSLLTWCAPDAALWIRPKVAVMRLLREKP